MASGIMGLVSITEKDRGIMPAGYDVSSVNQCCITFEVFTMSDIHVYDKESPSQPFYDLGYYNSYESGENNLQ